MFPYTFLLDVSLSLTCVLLVVDVEPDGRGGHGRRRQQRLWGGRRNALLGRHAGGSGTGVRHGGGRWGRGAGGGQARGSQLGEEQGKGGMNWELKLNFNTIVLIRSKILP